MKKMKLGINDAFSFVFFALGIAGVVLLNLKFGKLI